MNKEKQNKQKKEIDQLMERREVEIQALKKILLAFNKDKVKEKK